MTKYVDALDRSDDNNLNSACLLAVAKFADVFEFDNSDQAAAVDVVALINVHLKDAYSEINSYLNARYQLPVFGSKVSVAAK